MFFFSDLVGYTALQGDECDYIQMGPQSQYLETVLTCEGDFYSPDFHRQLSVFRERLHQLIFLGTS